GVYRNDTLFAVWEDFRHEKSSIYGTAHPVERIVAGVGSAALSETRTVIAAIVPNPMADRATIIVTVGASDEASLEVMNLRGEVARRLSTGRLNVGEHWIELETEGLASGEYLVVLRSSNQTDQRRLVIVR